MTAGESKVPKKTALEWAVFVAGLVLSLGTMGFLGWEALSGAADPAALSVQLDAAKAIPTAEGRYQVPVVVYNRGGTTAEAVRIEVIAGGTPSELEFDFVPHGSSRKGVVFLHADPADATTSTRIVSFRTP